MSLERQPQASAAPQVCLPSRGTLAAALDVARALARAERAALFFETGAGLMPLVSTLGASQLFGAYEECAIVAASGRSTSGMAPVIRNEPSGKPLAFMAVPLVDESHLVGVLYLEGLDRASLKTQTDVRRCASIIAIMLRSAADLDRRQF